MSVPRVRLRPDTTPLRRSPAMPMNTIDRPALQPWRALATRPGDNRQFPAAASPFRRNEPMGRADATGLAGLRRDLYTRGGERVAVRVGCGFHRPTAAQAAILSSPWSAALRRSEHTPHDLQLYLRAPPRPTPMPPPYTQRRAHRAPHRISSTTAGRGLPGGRANPRPIDRTSDRHAANARRVSSRSGAEDAPGGATRIPARGAPG